MFQTIHLRKLLSSLALTLGTGLLSGFLAGNQGAIYTELNRPPLSPPGAVFGIVWTILYLCMGIALYLVRMTPGKHDTAQKAFGLQLFLNFCWSLLFFGLRWYCFSALWLGLLLLALVWTMLLFYRIQPAAFWWLVPYLLWCCFALYLNIGVCVLN